MARILILAALAVIGAAPARADPILTPLITLLVSAAGLPATLSVFGITFGTASILGAVVTTAVGIGLALLFAPHPKLPTPEAGIIAVQQTLPYRIFVYGRSRVAGAVMLKEAVAASIVYVAALAGHFIDGFETLFLNDDEVTVPPEVVTAGGFVVGTYYTILVVGTTDWIAIGASSNTVGVSFKATGAGSGTGTATTPNLIGGYVGAGADGRYGGNTIDVHTRQGLFPETNYPFITTILPSNWDITHRGDGQASLGMSCEGVSAQTFIQTYPYGCPSPSVIMRGYQVYDPRAGAQNPNAPSTWAWSENAALCTLHFLCFSEFGFRAEYATAILPFIDQWIQAANDCDDQMPLASGGTESRYTMGGWTTTEQSKIATLLAMLQCCDGFLSRRGEGYWIQIGKYYAPTVTITDADIAGFVIQTDVSSEDKINEATAYWSDPDNGYVTVDTDPIINTADQVARGGAPRKAQLQLPWVHSVGQASRLLVREMYRQEVTVRGTLTLGWSGLNAVYERWIAVNSNSIPRLSGVVIENRKAVFNPKMRTVAIDFILSGPSIDVYNPATQQSSVPFIPQRPYVIGLPVPANVTVVATLTTDTTGVAAVVLDVAWDEPLFNGVPWNLTYLVQWRLTNGGSGSPGPWTQQSYTSPTIAALRVTVQTGVVPSGTSIDVEVASVGTGATLSTYSAIVTVSTILTSVAPAPPTWVSAVGGTSAVLTVTAPPSPNVFKIQFYRAITGNPFSSAVGIGFPVATTPNATTTYTDTPAAGTYDYFAQSRTSTLVESAPAGPETAVVT